MRGRDPKRPLDDVMKEGVMRKIAGEITLSKSPGLTMKKWRTLFEFKQREVALKMGVAPSVLSDYEKGKRRSPGIGFIKKFVESIVELDESRGATHIHRFVDITQSMHHAIMDIKEFKYPIRLSEVSEAIDGLFLTYPEHGSIELHGYTVVDSVAAIRYMDASEFIHLFGMNSMRLMVFSGVTTGRSPLVAIKVFPMKPRALAVHGPRSPGDVDWLAVELAESLGIPLILSRLSSINLVISSLRRLGE